MLALATTALFAAGATAAIATIVGTVAPYRHRIAALLTTGSQIIVITR
jgi:hypothetical protein